MLVYFDQYHQHQVDGMGRYHPWTVTVNTEGGRYVDFKTSPELIRTTLEDLPRVAGSEAETAILDFITWANGPASIFETNDFGMRPPKANESGVSSSALELLSRVTIFFRDLDLNVGTGLALFATRLETAIKSVDTDFWQACWSWCLWPHLFLSIEADGGDAEGAVIALQVWAWGDDPSELHKNMARAYSNLRAALEIASTEQTPVG
jgi:hypothetical protein